MGGSSLAQHRIYLGREFKETTNIVFACEPRSMSCGAPC